ncbi:MAG: serine/threonine-protein kinase [Deltaproteobacteria bacterium]|nr:serine/threonine-protein kinase [Deltaproteobacteria bacterium]
MQAPQEIQPVPFGSYQLLERLAMGGMAEVFLARPDGQDRLVALKRILPNIAADDEFIAMFIDEAKIAGQLTHANVAQIIDIGKITGSYFIAMEYVSGHDLRALWDRTREQAKDAGDAIKGLPIGVCCHIVKKLSEGLDFAHRRRDPKGRPLGIIHRDVSPQNILISYEGDLKIIDFGIAKAANRIVKTQTGILKGKFAYMAPEQARGEPIDHRSDIFAIGVVLYELLTGERAFKGDTDFALLEKVRRVEVTPPKQLRPDLPKELERIVMKALGKEASDRYAWASVLASDLDRFLSDQGISTSREELGAFVRRTFRDEHAEEIRRLNVYRKQGNNGNSGSRSRARIDGNGATVVRGGPSAKNGVKPGDKERPGDPPMEPTAVGDAIDDSDLDEIADEIKPPDTKPGKRRAVNVDNKSAPELVALRDQAVKVARGTNTDAPASNKAISTAVGPTVQSNTDDPGVVSSPSRSNRLRGTPAPEREAFSNITSSPSSSSAAQAEVSALLQPFEPSSLPPREGAREARQNNNVVIVLACLLGALLGAGLGVGISMAIRMPAPDTLVVTLPRQAEVKQGDVVVCAQTPCALHLGKGRHELLLQAPGAEAVTRVVEVGDGPAVLDVILERTARAIRLESEPSGAAIMLDDVPLKEVTPMTLPPLAVGKQVQLVLTRDGYEPLTTVRTIEGDGVWRFDMPTATTTYSLTAIPADALIDAGAKEAAGKLAVLVGKRALPVKVSRPGCETKVVTLVGTGKAAGTQAITLDCRDFDGRISIQAPKRPIAVKIDGVTLPRGVDLSAYPLPAGTWNVVLTSPRGKRDAQMVEVVRGVNTPVISRVK